MGLINTKCPECGAALKINDQAKGELRCPYCGSTYLAENAIHITNINNTVINNNSTSITANNVNIDIQKANYVNIKIGYFYRVTNQKGKKLYGNPGFLHVEVNGQRIGNVHNLKYIEYPIDITRPNTIIVVPEQIADYIDKNDERTINIGGTNADLPSNYLLYFYDVFAKQTLFKDKREYVQELRFASQNEVEDFNNYIEPPKSK